MFTQKLRKVGNSLVVTIPKDEAERLGLIEGDQVLLDLHKALVTPMLDPAAQAALDAALARHRADLEYLKDR